MACHVGTSKYSRDAHKDRALQLHYIFVVAMYMEECFLYVCLKYFVLIIWWLTIFNKCIFDVANVGRSLAFIGKDGFYR